MRSWSTTNDFQTDGTKVQTLAFTSNQPDTPIKNANFKIDEHGFTLSIQFLNESAFDEFYSHESCSLSDFDDLAHTFKFNLDNLKINKFNELLNQLFKIDNNFDDTRNEIKKLVNYYTSMVSSSSPSITNNFVQLFKILLAIHQMNQRSIMSSYDRVPYNSERSFVSYEKTDFLMQSFLFSQTSDLSHSPFPLFSSPLFKNYLWHDQKPDRLHNEAVALGLSYAEAMTSNFDFHTIDAIKTIQKRTPELSSTEAFTMVKGKSPEATQQAVTHYLISTNKAQKPISEMTLIRVLVNTGRGFGHQRAAITLMQKLREIGFRGTFDVQCNDRIGANLFNTKTRKMYQNHEPLVSRELIAMIPGFASSKPNSEGIIIIGELGAIKISSLPDGYAKRKDLELLKADLAISAAEDHILDDELKCSVLNAECYIGLEPTDWCRGSCFVTHQDGIVVKLPNASTTRLSSATAHQLPDISSISLSTTEQKIIDISKNDRVNTQLVYGLYPDREYSVESNQLTETGNLDEATEVQRIIDANLLVSQNTGKPSVLLLPQKIALYDYFIERVKDNNPHVYFADLTKNDLDLDAYKAGDVVVAHTGYLQQIVFDHLMLRGTTLPPVIEGCNAVEVCESAGRPFIHGSGKHRPIKQYAIKRSDKQQLHTQASLCLEQGESTYVPQLIQYMEESLTSNPELMAYHAQRREEFLKRPDACELAFDMLGIPYQKIARTKTQESTFKKFMKIASYTTLGFLFFASTTSLANTRLTENNDNENKYPSY